MTISQLIEALELARNQFGDLPVRFYDSGTHRYCDVDKAVDADVYGDLIIELDTNSRPLIT
jgi:hypothetical protein